MTTKEPPKTPKQIEAMERRRAQILQRIAKIGPVLYGTITRRSIVRDDPRNPGMQKEYGPYNQWTWKREGKTVTVNLSANQLKPYQHAIAENRKLEDLLQQLREVSMDLLEAKTDGVAKRSRSR